MVEIWSDRLALQPGDLYIDITPDRLALLPSDMGYVVPVSYTHLTLPTILRV